MRTDWTFCRCLKICEDQDGGMRIEEVLGVTQSSGFVDNNHVWGGAPAQTHCHLSKPTLWCAHCSFINLQSYKKEENETWLTWGQLLYTIIISKPWWGDQLNTWSFHIVSPNFDLKQEVRPGLRIKPGHKGGGRRRKSWEMQSCVEQSSYVWVAVSSPPPKIVLGDFFLEKDKHKGIWTGV